MSAMQGRPLEEWPEADRQAWLSANTEAADPWDSDGAALRLRPATRRGYERAYGLWLAWLDASRQLMPHETPSQRVTPERVRAWIAHMRAVNRKAGTIKLYLMSLHAIMRIMAPETDTRFVIYPGGRSVHELFPTSGKPFVPRDAAALFEVAARWHRQGLATEPGLQRWIALRDAAIMAVLYTRAPRVSDYAAIEIGEHLLEQADGSLLLRFPGSMTKGRRMLEYPLDPACAQIVRDYINLSRPHLPGSRFTNKLWLGKTGRPLTGIGLTGVVKRRNLDFTGAAEGPHMARKWLTNTARSRSPQAAFDAAEVLGHSVQTALKHYAQAHDLHAGLRHGRHVAKLRQNLAGVAARAFADQEVDDGDGGDGSTGDRH